MNNRALGLDRVCHERDGHVDLPMTRVWDLPVRIFHWGLVFSFAVAFLTEGDGRYLHVHAFSGYVVLGLLAFRILWGVLGGRLARFSSFAFRPREGWKYLRAALRGEAERHLGHNPAGSMAVWALLALPLAVAVSGVMVLGGEEGHGPLAGWMTIAAGVALHGIHEWLAWATLVLVGVHLAGVLAESILHRDNLAAAMVTGRKRGAKGLADEAPRTAAAVALLATIALSGGAYFQGWLGADTDHPWRPYVGPRLPDDPLWREECGSCHLAFHPSLLPARSWNRLFDGTGDHFGDDLYLEQDTVATLRRFHTTHAAEHAPTEAAWRMIHTLEADAVPLRITETPLWRDTHHRIAEAVWSSAPVNSRANCGACHLDAGEGTFEDGAMAIPDRGGRSAAGRK